MKDPLLVRLGESLDRLPMSPAQLGRRIIHLQIRAAERRARHDPEWRTWTSRHAGAEVLSVEAVEEQVDILNRHRRSEWLSALAHSAQQRTFRSAGQRLVTRWQLARRGWASEDTWSLRGVLARRLGAQLVHLADVTNGWPGTDEFATPEEWVEALRKAGTALQEYETADVYELPADEAERIQREAKEALRWVADHLEHLWW